MYHCRVIDICLPVLAGVPSCAVSQVAVPAAVVAAARCCVVSCTSVSPVVQSSLQQLSALADDGYAIREGCRLCDAHRKRASRLVAATTAAAVAAPPPLCCYCELAIVNQRPCKPVIEGVVRDAHTGCVAKKKRLAAATTVAAAAAAVEAAVTAAEALSAEQRRRSLRSSGECTIVTTAVNMIVVWSCVTHLTTFISC